MLLHLFLVSLVFISTTDAIKCHVCGGAEKIPKFAKSALTKLNISSDQIYGDCKSTSGGNACQEGTFCIKRAKVYQIGYSGISLKWTTYTKGCATLREDNNQTPTETCYDLGKSSNGTGYSMKRLDCYCKNDFCNSSQLSFTLLSFITSIICILYTL